ncbi:MAG: hypothetical protein U0235_31500 [Polyangiaceae bacterium]
MRYDAQHAGEGAEDDSRHTIAAAVARAVTKNVRVALEYDHVIDRVHAPDAPAPAEARRSPGARWFSSLTGCPA